MGGPGRRRDRAFEDAQDCGRARAAAALRRQGAGHIGLFPRSGWLADGVHVLRRCKMTEAPGTHNPNILPPNIPVPQDDGADKHLAGMKLPDLALPATSGAAVNLAKLTGRTVVYIYPRTGVPGVDTLPGWDQIPGARGCTPQSCSFRDHFGELKRLGVAQLYGLSAQDTAYQKEAATRLHLPFAILSDEKRGLTKALKLPTFTAAGMTLLKRMALVIDDGVIGKVFYPVFPPDQNAAQVIAWLQAK